MTQTDYLNSRWLVVGLNLLEEQYKTDTFTINVIETSGISVRGLRPISDQDLEFLRSWGWSAGNSSENNESFGWADYFKLKYVDY